MLNRAAIKRGPYRLLCLSTALLGFAAVDVLAAQTEEATLTSDQMELLDNGRKTVFTGRVVLKKPPYVLKADRMTRTQPHGLVEAEGHIVGTWTGGPGEKTEAVGEHARYDPQTETAELWTEPGRQITIKWKNARGSGQFLGDRALLLFASKQARLLERVTGHIVPAP